MGFGIRVQRMWKINLAGCSGPQKRYNARFQTYFGPILGDPPSRPCAWGFRTRVQGKGSKHGFRVMVQRTGKTLFGRLLWAFRESA